MAQVLCLLGLAHQNCHPNTYAANGVDISRMSSMTSATGLSNEELPAAFWDTLPKTSDHPDQLAIEALRAESTPDEQAETHKVLEVVTYGCHWLGLILADRLY